MSQESCSEEAEKVLDRGYDLIEESDELISITERGLLKAISDALLAKEREAFNQAVEECKKVAENEYMNGVLPPHTAVRDFIANEIEKLKKN